MKRSPRSLLYLVIMGLLLVLGGNSFLGGSLPAGTQAPGAAVEGASAPQLQEGPVITPQAIAAYLFKHGELPDNFITKQEAQKLGWDSAKNYVSDVAPGKSIGGDRFGNYEKLLPDKPGRVWRECDCYYESGPRNAYRICYSNDGLVYYTDDHYKNFTQMQRP